MMITTTHTTVNPTTTSSSSSSAARFFDTHVYIYIYILYIYCFIILLYRSSRQCTVYMDVPYYGTVSRTLLFHALTDNTASYRYSFG